MCVIVTSIKLRGVIIIRLHRTCGVSVASQPPSNHHQGVDDNIIDFPLFPRFVTAPDVTCRNWRENVTLDPACHRVTLIHRNK